MDNKSKTHSAITWEVGTYCLYCTDVYMEITYVVPKGSICAQTISPCNTSNITYKASIHTSIKYTHATVYICLIIQMNSANSNLVA